MWGWLTPVILPVMEILGRSPKNIVLVTYVVWGVVILLREGLGADKLTRYLFYSAIALFGLGLFVAVDPARAIRTWLKFSTFVLMFFATCHVLSVNKDGIQRQFRLLALTGVLSVVALIAKGLIVSSGQALVTPHTMQERNLPFLLPFLFFAIRTLPDRALRWTMIAGAGSFFTVVIALSGGRSAFVALLVSVFVYCLSGFRIKLHVALSLLAVMAVVVIAVSGGMSRNIDFNNISDANFDKISSNRTVLWRQAIADWPDSPLIGVGMGNVRYTDVVYVPKKDKKVRHLHNFLLDCWYETGFAGLFVYVCLLARLLFVPLKCYRMKAFSDHQLFAPLYAGVAAILAGGMFSFSYYSPQMTIYMFFLFATLFVLERQHTNLSAVNDVNDDPL